MTTERARLTYSNSRGYGEKIRLMLCICEIPYENVAMKKRQEFLQLRDGGHLLFGQTPLLEYNGMKLVQSHSIMRYLAAKHNMYGSKPEEEVRIDMFYEAYRDFAETFARFWFYGPREDSIKEGKGAMDRFCPVFEKELENNKTGYLVGQSLTLADVGLLEILLELEEHYGIEELKKYPNILAFLERMKSQAKIQDYIKNHRFPAFTPETVNEVCDLFAYEKYHKDQ